MKNVIKITFILLLTLSFILPKTKTDLQRENLKGKVNMVTTFVYSGIIKPSHLTSSNVDKYNVQGKLIDKGYITQDSSYKSNCILVHNSMDQLIEETHVEDNGEKHDKWVFKYDNNSNCIKQLFYYDGTFLSTCNNAYDAKGNKISNWRGLPKDTTYKETFKYDSSGNLIESKDLNWKTKKMEAHYIYTYENFDKEGNWLLQVAAPPDGSAKKYSVRKIEYY